MRAVVYKTYGSTDHLRLEELPVPEPKKDQIQIKIAASSVNSWDWDMLIGKPIFIRMWGLLKPKYRILGGDMAGVVSKIGPDVTKFRVGDRVFGDLSAKGWGGFAEYTVGAEKYFTKLPQNITFENASTIPQAGLLALQALRFKKLIKPGDKILINGGGGGVGTFAIQLAKRFGAEVTGVDKSIKFETMRSAGADFVIDYQTTDFTKNGIRYDRIVDMVANRSVFTYSKCLNKGGVFAMVGGKTGKIFQTIFLGWLFKVFVSKNIGIMPWYPNADDLNYMAKLHANNELEIYLDKIYPLDQTKNALARIGKGDVKGKVVVRI